MSDREAPVYYSKSSVPVVASDTTLRIATPVFDLDASRTSRAGVLAVEAVPPGLGLLDIGFSIVGLDRSDYPTDGCYMVLAGGAAGARPGNLIETFQSALSASLSVPTGNDLSILRSWDIRDDISIGTGYGVLVTGIRPATRYVMAFVSCTGIVFNAATTATLELWFRA